MLGVFLAPKEEASRRFGDLNLCKLLPGQRVVSASLHTSTARQKEGEKRSSRNANAVEVEANIDDITVADSSFFSTCSTDRDEDVSSAKATKSEPDFAAALRKKETANSQGGGSLNATTDSSCSFSDLTTESEPFSEGQAPSVDENAEVESRDFVAPWTPEHLVDRFPELSLVVDLTNTNRYYDSKQLQRLSKNYLGYVKIFTTGHEIPSSKVVQSFFRAVDKALEKNDDALVGVHCTHGVNRTGYLICRYLIQKRNWTPEEALNKFHEARGFPVERENYIKDLRRAKWPKLGSKTPEPRPKEYDRRRKQGHQNENNGRLGKNYQGTREQGNRYLKYPKGRTYEGERYQPRNNYSAHQGQYWQDYGEQQGRYDQSSSKTWHTNSYYNNGYEYPHSAHWSYGPGSYAAHGDWSGAGRSFEGRKGYVPARNSEAWKGYEPRRDHEGTRENVHDPQKKYKESY